MWKIQLFKLNYGKKEYKAVEKVLKSGWITMGEKTLEFENNFKQLLGGTPCVAVANGTAALHLAALAAGITYGDEVIVPSLTFVADANAVTMCGATPVVADVTSFEDWNLSVEDIRKKITPKTKAVLIVHFAGYACDMDELVKLCKENNLILIEDCAHAPGGKYKGRPLGSIGDFGCFSFFTNKNLSVGEGGMVSTNNLEFEQKIKYLRSHGMTSLTLDRHKGRTISYDVAQAGLNYRIDEMRAALGVVQLAKLEKSNKRRREIVNLYNELLKDTKELTIPFLNFSSENVSTGHIYTIMLDEKIDRIKFIEKMKDAGIQISIHYPEMVNFTAYKNILRHDVPLASEISKREVTLPLYPELSDKQVKFVANTVKNVIKELGV